MAFDGVGPGGLQRQHSAQMIGADHELPKSVLILNLISVIGSIVVSVMYIKYTMIYGDDWGEGYSKNKCPGMFPTYYFVTGIISLVIFVFLFAISFLAFARSHTSEGGLHDMIEKVLMLVVGCFAAIIVPTACFMSGWGIYGLVLLIQAERKCGPKLYDLVIYALIASLCWNFFMKCLVGQFAGQK